MPEKEIFKNFYGKVSRQGDGLSGIRELFLRRIRSFAGVHVEPRKTRIFILLFYSGALLSYASSVFSLFQFAKRNFFIPNSTDGMLFVISRPNRQKSQTNNERKGEKYGKWSYSYHRW